MGTARRASISLIAGLLISLGPLVNTAPPASAAGIGTVSNYTGAGIVSPQGVATGPDAAIWFTNYGSNSLGRITTGGAVSIFADASINTPTAIAPGPDGALWFTNAATHSIGRATTAGVITNYTGVGLSSPYGITAGPDGALWFANRDSNSIGRITTSGVVSNFVGTGIAQPQGITAGPDGNLWFTNFGNNTIGRITVGGSVSNFPVSGPGNPRGIVTGPDGNLWFTDLGTATIGRITPGGVVTKYSGTGINAPTAITAGQDGALWFANVQNNSIGRITTAGVVSNYTGTGIGQPAGIVAGPDGGAWFTNSSNNSIGRIQVQAPAASPPTPPLTVTGAAGNAQVTVSWVVPADDGGSPIIGYTATAAPGGATCTWSSGPLSCVVSGLTNGTTYTFTVAATNANGTGPPSSPSSGVVPTPPSLLPTTAADSGAAPGAVTLRSAIAAANVAAVPPVVTLEAGTTYVLDLGCGGADESANATGDLDVTTAQPVTIRSNGTQMATISALSCPGQRVLDVIAATNLTLDHVVITGGHPGAGLNGGGINAPASVVTLTDSRVTANTAGAGSIGQAGLAPGGAGGEGGKGGSGGGIYTATGSIIVTRSVIDNNAAGDGGTGGIGAGGSQPSPGSTGLNGSPGAEGQQLVDRRGGPGEPAWGSRGWDGGRGTNAFPGGAGQPGPQGGGGGAGGAGGDGGGLFSSAGAVIVTDSSVTGNAAGQGSAGGTGGQGGQGANGGPGGTGGSGGAGARGQNAHGGDGADYPCSFIQCYFGNPGGDGTGGQGGSGGKGGVGGAGGNGGAGGGGGSGGPGGAGGAGGGVFAASGKITATNSTFAINSTGSGGTGANGGPGGSGGVGGSGSGGRGGPSGVGGDGFGGDGGWVYVGGVLDQRSQGPGGDGTGGGYGDPGSGGNGGASGASGSGGNGGTSGAAGSGGNGAGLYTGTGSMHLRHITFLGNVLGTAGSSGNAGSGGGGGVAGSGGSGGSGGVANGGGNGTGGSGNPAGNSTSYAFAGGYGASGAKGAGGSPGTIGAIGGNGMPGSAGSGSAIATATGMGDVEGSVLAGPSPACAALSVVSNGHNAGTDASCLLTASGDTASLTPAELNLSPLQDNAGPGLTALPQSPSVLIDAIPAAACSVPADERGVRRPHNGGCEIGALELADLPGPPASVVASPKHQSAIVTWDPPADDGGWAITTYQVTASPGGHGCSWTTGPLKCSVTGLMNGTSYTFAVTATNPQGAGPSATSGSTTPTPQPPDAPLSLTVVAGNATAAISWATPSSDGGMPITNYTIKSSPGNKTCTWISGPLTCVVSGLTNGTAYTFTATATNSVGTGPSSDASAPATPVTTPGKPTGVSGTRGDGQVSISWMAPLSSGGGPITGYTATASPTGATCTWVSGPLSCTVGGLTNGSAYTFTVTATNVAGTGLPSAPSGPVTPGTVPSAPTSVSGLRGNAQVAVSWVAPTSNGGAAITGYTATAIPGGATCSWASGPLSCTVSGLTNGTAYSFTVTASNAVGSGAASSPSSTITPATVPGAPTSVAAVAGKQQVTVSWSPPASNGGTALTSYTVTASPGGSTCGWVSGPLTCTVAGLSAGSSFTFTVVATSAVGASAASLTSNSVTPWDGSGYHPVTPSRILDSRTTTGGWNSRLSAATSKGLQVSGLGGASNVPLTATAAVLNVTATGASSGSFITLFPTGASPPNASNLNFGPGQTIANLVTVKLGAGGNLSFANAVGSVDVIADVVGFYDDGTGPGDLYNGTTPKRLLDSRTATGDWNGQLVTGTPRDLIVRQPGNAAGVPATAAAVIANVTVTGGTHGSFLSAWPSGVAQPNVSNLNFAPGQTIPNLAIIKIGSNGAIRFANAVGGVDVIVDVVGYFDPTTGSRFHAINPTRVLDDRVPTGLPGPWGPGQTRALAVAGAIGTNVPVGATGLVTNVTVTGGTAGSFVTVFPDGVALPNSSNVNFGPGQTIPNLVTVKVAANGKIDFFNKLGSVDIIADAVAYYAAT